MAAVSRVEKLELRVVQILSVSLAADGVLVDSVEPTKLVLMPETKHTVRDGRVVVC
jgi:hypothetical protein